MLFLLEKICYRRLKRGLRYWWQRRTRGWDDSDLWSLDYTLAKWIVPRLERFKEVRAGVPYIEGFEVCGTHAQYNAAELEWVRILDKMIRAFKLIIDDNDRDELVSNEEWQEVSEGLELFSKYFRNLWW